ncbi:ABC transporter permease [Streptomyces wuyuanensis]|uniref:ABC transporter permease n=1 Tax=Streptomyces wuyuanensis TaxID=1196353 RepID=UPI00341362D1
MTVSAALPLGGALRARPRLLHSVRTVRVVWQRELLRFLHERVRMGTTLLQPLMFLFVLGAGLGGLTHRAYGVDFTTFVYPGALVMPVLFSAVMSAGSIVWDREFGFLREMLVAPVGRTAIVVGKALGGATTATIQGAVVLALARAAGVPYDPALMLTLLGEMALLAFMCACFGVMVAARISSLHAFMGVSQMAVQPLFFTSGAMFTLTALPGWLAVVNRFNPLTYAVDPIRRAVFAHLHVSAAARAHYAPGVAWGGRQVPVWAELLIVAATALIMLAVAGREFRDTQ